MVNMIAHFTRSVIVPTLFLLAAEQRPPSQLVPGEFGPHPARVNIVLVRTFAAHHLW